MRAAKAQASLHICAGSHETLLLDNQFPESHMFAHIMVGLTCQQGQRVGRKFPDSLSDGYHPQTAGCTREESDERGSWRIQSDQTTAAWQDLLQHKFLVQSSEIMSIAIIVQVLISKNNEHMCVVPWGPYFSINFVFAIFADGHLVTISANLF